MTRFEKDLQAALAGDEIAVITKRENEIINLKNQLGKTKNNFRAQCIVQEISKLQSQLAQIQNNF